MQLRESYTNYISYSTLGEKTQMQILFNAKIQYPDLITKALNEDHTSKTFVKRRKSSDDYNNRLNRNLVLMLSNITR